MMCSNLKRDKQFRDILTSFGIFISKLLSSNELISLSKRRNIVGGFLRTCAPMSTRKSQRQSQKSLHHLMVVTNIFTSSSKTIQNPFEKSKKILPNECSSQEWKGNGKKKEKGILKVQSKLSREQLEEYRKKNGCYKCGEQGHSYHACPTLTAKKDSPQATNSRDGTSTWVHGSF